MPPRTRTRASKALKENIGGKEKCKVKSTDKPRRVLADKTNSASDDNASVEPLMKAKTVTQVSKTDQGNKSRPPRERRLPSRYVENQLLANLSNNNGSKDFVEIHSNINNDHKNGECPLENHTVNTISPLKKDTILNETSSSSNNSPFKTPSKQDSSLIRNRPKRIHRLPSRFEDHSISPHKYIPIQPTNASTPIQLSKEKNDKRKKDSEKHISNVRQPRAAKKAALQKKICDDSTENSSPDTNNNPKGRSLRVKKNTTKPQPLLKVPETCETVSKHTVTRSKKVIISPKKVIISSKRNNVSSIKKIESPMKNIATLREKTASPRKNIGCPKTNIASPKKKIAPPKKNIASPKEIASYKQSGNNLSYRVLENQKTSQCKDSLDVYEFTFDPNEEPKPQKKKRKNVTKKRPPKHKTVIIHNYYDQNINKALAALRTAVTKNKPSKSGGTIKPIQAQETSSKINTEHHVMPSTSKINNNQKDQVNKINPNSYINDTSKNSLHEGNYASIRIEDIAADIEPSMDHHDDINYSPVNSPSKPKTPTINPSGSPKRLVNNNDPLNLQEDFSFFDDQPVASSSMNVSTRHPLASPWRVEFGNLPIKWPVNAYIKPNMTPAIESSFINSSGKKHVYTNMVAESNDALPEIVDDTPNLKQTSIISFIKEVAERSASKRKRHLSVTPTKANSLFEDLSIVNNINETPMKHTKKIKDAANNSAQKRNNGENVSTSSNDNISEAKENSNELRRGNRKRKNLDPVSDGPAKSPFRKKDTDCTYFGFDDSENQDQENVSPAKIKNAKVRALRARARPVLQEINAQTGPTRATVPAKSKIASSSEAVNKVYEELKSAADAPVFPDKGTENQSTVVENNMSLIDDDSQSVHLFEDIELIHHLKPHRKSYGKPNKKVTFRQSSNSDSEISPNEVPDDKDSSYDDDLGDLTFEVPDVKEKKTRKKRPKKQMTKKEEKEAEEWAANFNSMCEDIEAFPLVIE